MNYRGFLKMLVREIEVGELQSRLSAGDDVVVYDIRKEAEVAQGTFPYAEHLAMHSIPAKMDSLPRDKDIVLCCRSGIRSYQACDFLNQQGFTNVLNLKGGIVSWAQRGFEVVIPELAQAGSFQ
tara:strand:+ start:233 stop:604 length:372 start_codon:yes stop_codon:yes gene_type:complete